MALICEAVLHLPHLQLLLGEFVVNDRIAAVPGHDLCVSLKFREYLGPDTLGLAGREYVLPLQALAELLEKQVGENPAHGANGVLTHSQYAEG